MRSSNLTFLLFHFVINGGGCLKEEVVVWKPLFEPSWSILSSEFAEE